jgi:hypothetical protein
MEFKNGVTAPKQEAKNLNYKKTIRYVTLKLRRDERKWLNEEANKAEEARRKGDIKEFYSITRKLTNRKHQVM